MVGFLFRPVRCGYVYCKSKNRNSKTTVLPIHFVHLKLSAVENHFLADEISGIISIEKA
jgi:hypothetical protein